jgi:hypothetical protein
MLIFSPKAKQTIDYAMRLLPASQQVLWANWSESHPYTRGPNQPWDDNRGPLPDDLVSVVLHALEKQKAEYRRMLKEPGISEDDALDIEGDLTHVKAVERGLYDNIKGQRHAAA